MQTHLSESVRTQIVEFLLFFPNSTKEKQNVQLAKLCYARNATKNITRAHVDPSLKTKSSIGKTRRNFRCVPSARQLSPKAMDAIT